LNHAEKRGALSLEEFSWCLRKGILFHLFNPDDSSHISLHVKQTVYCESWANSDHDIGNRWKQFPVQTEDLPYQPLDSVPPHRISGFFLHTDSQPAVLKCVWQEDHGKSVTSEPPTGLVNALKIPDRSQ
jgi:hypothetical protein